MSKHKLEQKAKQVVRTKVILWERYQNSSKHAHNFANVDACKFLISYKRTKFHKRIKQLLSFN